MKVAIVHDYLMVQGGAEEVLADLHDLFPKAPIYLLILDNKGLGKFSEKFKGAKIITSWFNDIPFASKLISPFRFLVPMIWKSFDFSGFDLIIDSSSWAITRGFKTKDTQTEICYCHTPPRYLYGYDTSRDWRSHRFSNLVKLYALVVNHFMRMYDFDMAQKVDYFIANSKNVAERIEKFYRRKSAVIYPPVEIDKIINSPNEVEEDFFLTGGRLVAAKNFDLIIKACKKAKVSLKIFGSGILERDLKKLADGEVEFLGKLSEEELISYYKKARVFVVAQKDEDFGMTTVEAMAAGTPVIAFKGGGYLETVVDGKTGVFFDELTVESLIEAIRKIGRIKISPKDCINQAKKFSKEKFEKEIKEFITLKVRPKRQ